MPEGAKRRAIEVEMTKPVSQGYLTSLWNQEAFRKADGVESLHSLTNRTAGAYEARDRVAVGVRVSGFGRIRRKP